MFFWNKKKKQKQAEERKETKERIKREKALRAEEKQNKKQEEKVLEEKNKQVPESQEKNSKVADSKNYDKSVSNKLNSLDANSIKTDKVKQKDAGTVGETKKGVYRVVYDRDDRLWKIKRDGAKRVIASMVTKDEALKRVKELSETKDVGFVVHKKDGKFQKK